MVERCSSVCLTSLLYLVHFFMIITTEFVTDRLSIAKSNFTAAALPFTILKLPKLIPKSLFLNDFLRHMATAHL